jgi:predicted small lipoprotein YifL
MLRDFLPRPHAIAATLLPALLAVPLAACGIKGPLKLPPTAPAAASPAAAPAAPPDGTPPPAPVKDKAP